MYPAVEQLITSVVTSAVTATVDVIQTKHNEEMLALQEIIKKSLLLKDFAFSTSLPDLNAFNKLFLPTDLLLKSTKW